MTIIEGRLNLDHGVIVTTDCLGKTFTSKIADVEVNVELPRAQTIARPLEEDGPPGDLYVIEPVWASSPWNWRSLLGDAPEEPNEWGAPLLTDWTSGEDLPSGAVSVRSARLWFSGVGEFSRDSELGTRVMDAKDAWLSRVSNWVECLTLQHISSRDDTKLRQRRTLDKILWTDTGGSSELLDIGHAGWSRYGPIDAMTADGFSNVLQLAAVDTVPDLAWQLLRDSFHAHGYAEDRRAVIDAAAALEVGYSRWLEDRLDGVDAQVAELILGSRATLGLKLEQAKVLGWVAPAGTGDLVSLRNRAVHGGYSPTQMTAARVLAAAREALGLFDPAHSDLIARSTRSFPIPEPYSPTSPASA
ncbi:hypothetical protein QFZ53_002910 [Microbacterium natoriense]|uniref:Apea-like HEPN domain-containing protein n=1 Tax=Microbacterium natoriense TaxID=284570 RepID=A0AAW8F0Q6_9MICO|nr:hypothetical protein [Microbacterium natoriense]MDQ0648714.1 hypothetical protein [Microbacterium natoriense]